MLMMLPSCLVKCAQSQGQLVSQHLESKGAMWPEIYPADAHDAALLPRQILVKFSQSLEHLLLQHLESSTQLMLVMLPSCLAKCAQSLGSWFCNIWSLGGPCGRKYPQLMLVMLPSCLVKCAQSPGQLVLQHLESRQAMWPEISPADAHDAPLLPRQMRAIIGAVGFATSGV